MRIRILLGAHILSHGLDYSRSSRTVHYAKRATELTVAEGCLVFGGRVVIPKVLQKEVLAELTYGNNQNESNSTKFCMVANVGQ